MDVTESPVQLLGGAGSPSDFPSSGMMRDARSPKYEAPTKIQHIVMSRALLAA